MFDRLFAWFRRVHDDYARVILATIATLLVPLMIFTAVATLDNWRQNGDIKAATAEQDRLLACFDDYAAASAVTSKSIRVASVRKDRATAEAWEALNAEGVTFLRLTKRLLDRTVTKKDFEALSDSLQERARAGRKLDRAQAALVEAREENPVPSAPSTFCNVKP